MPFSRSACAASSSPLPNATTPWWNAISDCTDAPAGSERVANASASAPTIHARRFHWRVERPACGCECKVPPSIHSSTRQRRCSAETPQGTAPALRVARGSIRTAHSAVDSHPQCRALDQSPAVVSTPLPSGSKGVVRIAYRRHHGMTESPNKSIARCVMRTARSRRASRTAHWPRSPHPGRPKSASATPNHVQLGRRICGLGGVFRTGDLAIRSRSAQVKWAR